MRYILDSEGYVEAVIFGGLLTCNNNDCTEYTGSVPSGYASLEEWNDNANIKAYKIVDGNLVYDSDRDAYLQALWETEQYNNANPTRAEVNSKLSQLSGLPTDSVIGWTGEEIPEGYEEIEIESGTSDYELLQNKPQIEGIELLGNKTFEELQLQALTNLELEDLINSQV